MNRNNLKTKYTIQHKHYKKKIVSEMCIHRIYIILQNNYNIAVLVSIFVR